MSELMPAAFIGHGNPMNALDHNRYTQAWTTFGASIPEPKAVLVISAHWYVNITAVTAMKVPRTIHDFYGFPQPLFDVEYPAPGDPELPKADVPVLQLSINAELPFDFHFNLGAKLHELRSEGVLILGSGNIVQNLRLIDWHSAGEGKDWAHRFDDAVGEIMTSDAANLGTASAHADYSIAVPTPDHFLPLAYVAGLSAAANTPTTTLIDGYEMGSLSMSAYQLAGA